MHLSSAAIVEDGPSEMGLKTKKTKLECPILCVSDTHHRLQVCLCVAEYATDLDFIKI